MLSFDDYIQVAVTWNGGVEEPGAAELLAAATVARCATLIVLSLRYRLRLTILTKF